MSLLPPNWILTTLGSIVIINPRHSIAIDSSIKASFVPMAGVSADNWKFNFTEEKLLDEIRKGFTHFAEGDVLLAKITPSMENGKAAVAYGLKNGLGCGTTELHVLRPVCGINPFYIYHFVHQETFRREAAQNMTGTAGQLRVPSSFIETTSIPLAPLNEQHRIVAKLEKILSIVDTCRHRLEKIPLILKRFRQSVLTAACSGRLTEDWRERNYSFWQDDILANLFSEKPKNGYSAKPVKYKTSFKILTLTATTSGVFKPEHYKYFDEKIPFDSPLWLKPGDILIQRGNSIEYVGVAAIYDGPSNEFVYPDLMIKLRAKDNINTKYLYYYLSLESTRNYFRSNATGTAGNMPKINQQVLLNTPIKVTTLPEQEEIVRRIDSLLKLADDIETHYQKAKSYIDKLTQSILSKAFRGELVPQDPNDEPASELLNRIKEERTLNINIQKNRETHNQKIEKKQRGVKSMKENKEKLPLLEVLEKADSHLTPEKLFSEAGFTPENIDDFYSELKREVSNGRIVEERPNKREVYLSIVQNENR